MSEKKALCIRSQDDLKNLALGKVESVMTFMVPRSICEEVSDERPYIQLIPYVSFTALEPQSGQLLFMTYERPVTGGEERLHGDKSVGFGGHIDSLEEVRGELMGSVEAYPGFEFPAVQMTRQDLVETIYNTAVREVQEELGFDLKTIGMTPETIQINLVNDEEPDDVGKVHMCVSIHVDLTPQSLGDLKNQVISEEREIANLNVVSLDLNEQMRFGQEAFEGLGRVLKTEQQFERWSILVIMERVQALMNFIKNQNTFFDLFKSAELNFARQLEQQRQQVEAAQSETVQTEEAARSLDPTDVEVKELDGSNVLTDNPTPAEEDVAVSQEHQA